MERLKDKVVIIPGAASGFGKEMALLFASEGAKIVESDISDKVHELPSQSDGFIEVIKTDVTDFNQVQELLTFCSMLIHIDKPCFCLLRERVLTREP